MFCQANQRALRKPHGHIGIAGAKAMVKRVFLDWLAHEKLEEFTRRGPLPGVAPGHVKNVIGMIVPDVGHGIVDAKLAPPVPGCFQILDGQVFIDDARNRIVTARAGPFPS